MSIKKETTPYIGVRLSRGKWAARIKRDGVTIQLGRFLEAKQAAKAYDMYIVKNNLNRETNFLKKKVDKN